MGRSFSWIAWFTSLNAGLHRVGRVHVLQHDLLDLDAGLVAVAQPLQLLLGVERDLLAADREHLVDAVVAHDLAHHRLVHVAEGLGHVADVEEVAFGSRIRYCTIHSTTATFRSPVSISDSACASGGVANSDCAAAARRAEAELRLQLALHRHLGHRLDPNGSFRCGPGSLVRT